MKVVDGIDMEKVKADKLKSIIGEFNKAKVGIQIKPGANPLGSAKAFVKAIEALTEVQQAKVPPEVADYYNLIVVSEEELAKQPKDPKPQVPATPAAKPPLAVAKKPPEAKAPPAKAKKPAAAAKPAKEKEPRVVQNGIMLPKPDSACGKAWAICDTLSKRKKGGIPAIAAIVAIAKEKGLNEGNVRCEFPRWKKFHSN